MWKRTCGAVEIKNFPKHLALKTKRRVKENGDTEAFKDFKDFNLFRDKNLYFHDNIYEYK